MSALPRWIFCLLATLTLLLAGCDRGTDTPPTEPEGTPGPDTAAPTPPGGEWAPDAAAEAEVQVDESNFYGAGAFLPRPAELTDWMYIEPPAYYIDDNLSELIDGGAASYVAMGHLQTAYAVLQMRQAPASVGREVGLEIYIFQMSYPVTAQGKYESDHETSTCEQNAAITHRHCLTSSSLDILVGPYYVRLNLDAQDAALIAPLVAVAAQVLVRLEQGGAVGTGEGTGP